MNYSGKDLLEIITRYVRNCRLHNPNIRDVTDDTLCNDGKIYYWNGTNGTDWDWRENNQTSFFTIFYKSTLKGFMRFAVYKNGTISGWGYADEGKAEGKPLYTEVIGKEKAYAIFKLMNMLADNKELWDSPLSDFDFNIEIEVNDDEKHSRIRKVRQIQNVTQIELADRVGVTQSTISDYENGRYKIQNMTLDLAMRLASALNCHVDDLITFYE